MSSKDLSQQVIKYWKIFAILLVCTVFTVLAAKTNFDIEGSIAGGIFVGLAIASLKGYLVAFNFMHLNDEKKNHLLDTFIDCYFSYSFIIYSSYVGNNFSREILRCH